MAFDTPESRALLFGQVYDLLETINALEPDRPDDTPSTPLVGAMLETMTNERLIALLRYVRDEYRSRWFDQSVELSRRSDLFDKLIIMKGQRRLGWVLRLHTYNLVSSERTPEDKKAMGTPQAVRSGVRQSNLGAQLTDDEENTHLHRWRLSSRFVTGGFNNVTWDENAEVPVRRARVLNKYLIPATAQAGSGQVGARRATLQGTSRISVRRTELYQAGDIVVYPILDPHSVNSGLAALTGTTMTLAHTGHGIIRDSYFFAEGEVPEVQQKPFSPRELIAALTLAITRLQLVELNNSLAQTSPAFRHLNAFETELLPRVAECIALIRSQGPHDAPLSARALAAMVDLPFDQLAKIIDMDTDALAQLIWDSQAALWNQDFARDAPDLLRRFPPPELAGEALVARARDHVEPRNVIGPRRR